MKILGDEIFAKDEFGKLKSRVGTIFLKTPGLVTIRGAHAMQRVAWIEDLNKTRKESGDEALSEKEALDEHANSVDLVFSEDFVLIRPDPNRMDLAFKADVMLQKIVSKRRIRFLNTNSAKVRNALMVRGENWRMSRHPITTEDIKQRILKAKDAIGCERIYYYNQSSGTRYLTAGAIDIITKLPADRKRKQITEIVNGMKARNRLGKTEIDLFPQMIPYPIKAQFRAIDLKLEDKDLFGKFYSVWMEYRKALPANLREESIDNLEWRNEMCTTLMSAPDDDTAWSENLIQDISPEFYRQIEWMPGGRVEKGRLIFDSIFDEAKSGKEALVADICDQRVRNIIFNLFRLFGTVEYVNVGRITHSLAREPIAGHRRGDVYLIQYKECGITEQRLFVIRFQKWGIAEHLDEGKSMLQSCIESGWYLDYILDRRLACLQLGMNLPRHVGEGHLAEQYRGDNQYRGTTIHSSYFVRSYIRGVASDKVPSQRFASPVFARQFANLMGAAGAIDMIVGRAATETGEVVFDSMFEVLQFDDSGLPKDVRITDQAGTFVKYLESFEELIPAYAKVPVRRKKFIKIDYNGFVDAYVKSFERELTRIRNEYLEDPHVFDDLFSQRPFDSAGSLAYRWHCILNRLRSCNPSTVAMRLREEIGRQGQDV